MQTVTFTLFHFQGVRNRLWAFSQMGLQPFRVGVADGLTFAKMLGTGGGNGFSIRPNFGAYAWLAAWDTEGSARDFFSTNPIFQATKSHSSEQFTVFLRPTAAHGTWNGVQPFQPNADFDAEKPVAVLTRARIRTRLLHRFWQYVPQTSRSIEDFAERTFSIGVGELPLIEQATFSLWTSGKAMKDFAYKSPHHAEVVRKTRELGWYSEELFARFMVIENG